MGTVHWLALTKLPGVGSVTIRHMVKQFGSAEAIFAASDTELLRIPRVTKKATARLRSFSLETLEEELRILAKQGFRVLTMADPDYPINLQKVNDAPALLYIRGVLNEKDADAIAIIGTRNPSGQAVALAERFGLELAERGFTIVSGLAEGIDTAAHRGALAAQGGRTLAVLGSGLKAIHPRENSVLAEMITTQGALLSEQPPETRARGAYLMARDRIISGLSRTVIVIQAGEKSGSLDTATKARRQGRPVLVLPGSTGTDLLIANGAAKVIELDSIDFDALSSHIRTDQCDHIQVQQLRLW